MGARYDRVDCSLGTFRFAVPAEPNVLYAAAAIRNHAGEGRPAGPRLLAACVRRVSSDG
jgi:hypothetical protein